MIQDAENARAREQACVQCGHVGSPIKVGPGPGWLALALWAGAVLFWLLGIALQSLWIGYLAAPVFLGALIYTLWYFYRRERACRHCGARWTGRAPPAGDAGAEAP